MEQRFQVTTTRTIYTFAWLRQVSWHIYKEAEKQESGRFLNCMASQVFSAFSVEACLNHVGMKILKSWDSIERQLSPESKLKLIAEKLNIRPDYSKRPYQTLLEMFSLRNALAHGKTEILGNKEEIIISWDEVPEFPKSKWEKKVSLHWAKMYLDDSESICRELLKKLPRNEEYLLFSPEISDWLKVPIDLPEVKDQGH